MCAPALHARCVSILPQGGGGLHEPLYPAAGRSGGAAAMAPLAAAPLFAGAPPSAASPANESARNANQDKYGTYSMRELAALMQETVVKLDLRNKMGKDLCGVSGGWALHQPRPAQGDP